MMNPMIATREEFASGDQVWDIDPMVVRRNRTIPSEGPEIGRVLGGQTYLIQTVKGDRKLVGANQLRQVEPSAR